MWKVESQSGKTQVVGLVLGVFPQNLAGQVQRSTDQDSACGI